ncbi:MAG: hypothetical protein IKI06_02820 [Prevotella sp.]|nr:hypothetical protein [Prevotella sp.]
MTYIYMRTREGTTNFFYDSTIVCYGSTNFCYDSTIWRQLTDHKKRWIIINRTECAGG